MSENELDPMANTLTRIYPKGTIPERFIWVPVQVSSGFPEAFGNDIRLEILKWVNAASFGELNPQRLNTECCSARQRRI
jgi:hypothetical protein